MIYFFFFSMVVYKTVEEALVEIGRRHPSVAISRDRASGYVATLSNLEGSTQRNAQVNTASAAGFAVDFVEQPEVAAALGVPRDAELRGAPAQRDPQLPNYDLVRIQQFIDGVRLFGADIAVSMRSAPTAAINSVTTRPATVPALDLTPVVSESAAREAASRHYAALAADPRNRLSREGRVSESERVVFDPARFGLEGDVALAWRLRLASMNVFVDAKDGHLIASYDDRPTVRIRLTHDCRQTFDCPLVLNENGAVDAVPPVGADAKSAHDAALASHAYFKSRFDRDGYDDAGGTGGKAEISMFVQVADFNNANWDRVLKRFEFGPGWSTLDIAAHEYTHAVTTFGRDPVPGTGGRGQRVLLGFLRRDDPALGHRRDGLADW